MGLGRSSSIIFLFINIDLSTKRLNQNNPLYDFLISKTVTRGLV